MPFDDSVKIPQKKDPHSYDSKQSSPIHFANGMDIVQRVGRYPQSLTPADARVLQRTIGNQALGRFMGVIGLINDNSQPVQREALLEEDDEKPIQMKKENRTGLPDDLKVGVEGLSGLSLDAVRVHYNSDRPAQVGALAYTQGSDIHVASGQERHLPHEAWHVVQQAQGRVQPTMQMQEVSINDDAGLEQEADEMGSKAVQFVKDTALSEAAPKKQYKQINSSGALQFRTPIIQRNYDAALARESEYAVFKRLKLALMYLNAANQKELRWREAQKGDAEPSIKARVDEFKTAMEKNRTKYDEQFQVLKLWYESSAGSKYTKDKLVAFTYDRLNKGDADVKHFLQGAMANYKAEADRQFDRAKIQAELLLGYRQEVGGLKDAKAKILDTNIWSWGVNQAWVEGGKENRASFRLSTDIGETALSLLNSDGATFLKRINPRDEGATYFAEEVNTLWHNQEDRPTWYALEIAGLLDMGYRKDTDDDHLLVPPRKTGVISPGVQNTGVDAYLQSEQ